MLIKLENNASLQGLQIEMRKVLKLAGYFREQLGLQLSITCGTNGEHSAGSYHYYGYAVDFRTRDLTDQQKQDFKDFLTTNLGPYYDVVLHDTHMHVEFDYDRYLGLH